MTIDVRRIQSTTDFDRLYELLVEYEASLPPDLRHGVAPNLQALSLEFADPNAAFLAIHEQTVSGCVAVTRLDPSTAVMMRLYVKPGYRGHGIARELVAVSTSFVRERGYARFVLDTDKARLNAAYRLYCDLGFRECEPYAAVDYASPTFMELRLART